MKYLKKISSPKEPTTTSFFVFGISQGFSLLGSGMTWFAFSIWIWQQTGRASDFVWFLFYLTVPSLLLSPFAGALIDRWNRKHLIILSDLAQGAGTIVVLFLYLNGTLQIWHLYVVGFFVAVFGTFQSPAYTASVTMMLPKDQYARGEALLGLVRSASDIFAPFLGAFLLAPIGMAGILTIDIITFILASIILLFFIPVPQPPVTKTGSESRGSFWQESIYGFRYIFKRPGLYRLTLVESAGNFFDNLGYTLVGPMILASTASNERIFGSVEALGALGATIGGGLLLVYGGLKRKIHGILGVWAISSLVWGLLMSLGSSLFVWASAAFIASFLAPIISTSDQALWQTKVAPDVQGRVFVIRDLLYELTTPIAVLLAGFLADGIFEPAMQAEGSLLSETFGGIVGTDAGAGMSLIILLAGILGALAVSAGYLFYSVRNIEDVLPDYDEELLLAGDQV